MSYGGHVSRFVHAGTWYVTARPHLVRQPGAGYDGQFVYRLSLAPTALGHVAHGITLDDPVRLGRVGLPLLAWLLSGGGQPAAVPVVLLLLEITAFTALGALGGLVARRAGRDPLWGLLAAAPAGLVFALLHDLTEGPAIALVVGGLLLWWSGRPVWAGGVWALAALTRETALLVAVAVALPRLLALRRPARTDLGWLLPAGVWVGWELAVLAVTGSLPLTSGGGDNIAPPFDGLGGLLGDLPHAAWHEGPLALVQLLLAVAVVALALPVCRSAPRPLPLLLGLSVLLAVLDGPVVWTGYDDLRFLAETLSYSGLVLLFSRRRLAWLGAASGAVWLLSLGLNRF